MCICMAVPSSKVVISRWYILTQVLPTSPAADSEAKVAKSFHRCPVCQSIHYSKLEVRKHVRHDHKLVITKESFPELHYLRRDREPGPQNGVQCHFCHEFFKKRQIKDHLFQSHGFVDADGRMKISSPPKKYLTNTSTATAYNNSHLGGGGGGGGSGPLVIAGAGMEDSNSSSIFDAASIGAASVGATSVGGSLPPLQHRLTDN